MRKRASGVIAAVLDACPNIQWRLVVTLCRLAGLRCPSEVGALTWGDVNWEKGRLVVRSPKTEHHGGEHAVRVVPIVPELRTKLDDAFHRPDAGTFVVPIAAQWGAGANLRTTVGEGDPPGRLPALATAVPKPTGQFRV